MLSVTKQLVAPRWMIARAVGARVAVGVHVGHHVVPQLALVLGGRVEVDVVDVGPQLGDLLVGVIGSPSSASASASATHSRRHVLNFRCGLHSAAISREA